MLHGEKLTQQWIMNSYLKVKKKKKKGKAIYIEDYSVLIYYEAHEDEKV